MIEFPRVSQGVFPQPSPGWRTNVTFINGNLLNPVSVYMVSIGFLYAYSQSLWHMRFPGTKPYQQREHNVVIYAVETSQSQTHILETGFAELALYDGIAEMSRRNRYQSVFIEMHVYEHLIGTVFVLTKGDYIDHKSNLTKLGIDRAVDTRTIGSQKSSLTYNAEDSGRYTDPRFRGKDLSVKYEWSNGPRIHSKEIFTAIIEAMIIVGHDGTHQLFEYLNAASVSGNCGLNLHRVGSGTDAPFSTSGSGATTLLYLLADLVVQQKRFQDLDFALEVGVPPDTKTYIEGFWMGIGSSLHMTSSNNITTS